jgi:hypothetical protein
LGGNQLLDLGTSERHSEPRSLSLAFTLVHRADERPAGLVDPDDECDFELTDVDSPLHTSSVLDSRRCGAITFGEAR